MLNKMFIFIKLLKYQHLQFKVFTVCPGNFVLDSLQGESKTQCSGFKTFSSNMATSNLDNIWKMIVFCGEWY